MEEEPVADPTNARPMEPRPEVPTAAPSDQPDPGESRVPLVIGIGAVVTLVVAATAGVILTRDASPKATAQIAVEICKKKVSDKLKDPDSARFGTVTAGDEQRAEDGSRTWQVAGSVNAKNSYGGYVGDKTFMCTATFPKGSESMTATASILD